MLGLLPMQRGGMQESVGKRKMGGFGGGAGGRRGGGENGIVSSMMMASGGLTGFLNEPTPPPEKVLKAVDKLGKRVTAPDVAAATGLSLSEATKQLSTLASITSGVLEVSNDGTIVYSFDKGYRGTLSARSGKRRLNEAVESVKPVLFYLVKVSFGVALISSIALIFTAILAIQSQSRDDRDDRRDYRGGGGMNFYFGPSYWWGPSPFDFLYYNSYRPYGVNRYRNPSEMSFLESVFSFLFGDGDPNSDLEERRYKQIAQVLCPCTETANTLFFSPLFLAQFLPLSLSSSFSPTSSLPLCLSLLSSSFFLSIPLSSTLCLPFLFLSLFPFLSLPPLSFVSVFIPLI